MVENLQNLHEAYPLKGKKDYADYVNYLEARGWRREQLTIDELNTQLSARASLAVGATGIVITVTVPAGQKLSMMGTQQVPKGSDARTAHSLRIRLAGTTDAEISFLGKIRITKEKSSEAIVQLARVYYSDVSVNQDQTATPTAKTDDRWYRFKQGVELNGQQRFNIYAVTPNIAIDSAHVTFALDCDLWTRED